MNDARKAWRVNSGLASVRNGIVRLVLLSGKNTGFRESFGDIITDRENQLVTKIGLDLSQIEAKTCAEIKSLYLF